MSGYQWVAGSMLEDIETMEGREPNDIDVMTFLAKPDTPSDLAQLKQSQPHLFVRDQSKQRYQVDPIALPLRSPASTIVPTVRYYYALYTHRRGRVWKGILQVELEAGGDDSEARNLLAAVQS